MKVVSNTTPIISLASIGKIDILSELFTNIIIPSAVYSELKAKKRYGYNEADLNFIKVRSIEGNIYSSLLLNKLDLGEAETIILAKDIKADIVLIDENIAFKIAKDSGLKPIRTLSILLLAKEQGLIDMCKPLLDEMVQKGRWYSQRVYTLFLQKAGEI